MATSTHNKYVSIPDWFSSSSSTPITSTEKPANITNVYYGGGGTTGITEIPIDNKTIVWQDQVITVPIDNDKIIINTEGKITTSGTTGVWELRQLTDGTNYIYTTYPVVTQLGITMYAGTDGLDLGSIYDGLPIDNATIYWDLDENGNKILKAVGSSGGVADSVAWVNVTGKPDWLLDGKIQYTEIEGIPDLYGKFVTFDLNETIDGIKTFTNGIKIGTSLINQSQNDVIYVDANLVVRGGITMYATGTVDIPSILDSLPVAGTESKGIASFDSSYFSVTNGKVTLLADNVGLNESELAEYLNTNNYAKKSDIPSLNGYATQSWVESKGYALNSDLMSLTTKVDDFLEGSDTDTIINKWLELEAFLSGLSESDNLAIILSAKADKDYVDDTFVTLTTTQTITGEKNFTGGLKVNGSPIYYDTEKKYWKLEGDLLVTGGVTMYGSDSSFTPSTIMDAIAVDGTTISKSGGVLKVIGGTGGGVADSVAWANITGKPTFATVATSGKYSDLSGTPSSLPASDVYSWAKASTKPSYSWSEITSKPTWIGSSKPTYSYSEITGAISTTELQNYLTQNSYLNVTSGDNRYLQLSGGTITGELHVSSTSTNRAIIRLLSAADVPNDLLFGTNGEYHWSITSRNIEEGRYIGLYNNKEGSNGWVFKVNYDTRVLDFMNTPTVNGNTIWHSDNDGSGSGLDADLLDGKHNGELTAQYFSQGKLLTNADTINTLMSGVYCYINGNNPTGAIDNNAILLSFRSYARNDMFQIANSSNTKKLYYRGASNIGNSYEAWSDWKEIAFTDSNVASATKLQTARTIWGQSFDGTGNVSGDISNTSTIVFDTSAGAPNIGYLWTNIRGMHMDMSGLGTEQQGTNLTLTQSGNVGIGTPNPSAKFQVNGNAAIYSSSEGVISLYRTVSDGGSYVDYYPLNQTSQKWRVGAGSVDEFLYEAADGSNLARICHHATKGTRLEVGKRFLSVQPSGSDADRSVITLISNGDSPTDFIMGSGNYAWSITSRNSAEGHLLGFYSALSGQYAMRVYKEGNVLVTGGITMYSDQRKKTILNHVELSLKQIADAPLIEHYYNSDDKKTTHVGSIAQYWANMNDWFCKLDSEGFYTMEIQNAALASAISIARELDRYETKTDKAIKKLKKRICELEEEVERLKSA